jgi:hypothetical protein
MTEICPEQRGAGIIEKWSYLLARTETGLYEENWLPLIRTLDAFTAVRNAVGG